MPGQSLGRVIGNPDIGPAISVNNLGINGG